MKRFTAFAFVFLFGALPAVAAPSACYTPAQFRAEQAVRYHTRLMIVGMRCQRILAAPGAYADYQAFTQRNQTVIRNQENQLVSYFKSRKVASPERALHTLRTNLANSMSMQANGPGVASFCKNYAGTLQQAKAMKPVDFQKWITQVNIQNNGMSTIPLCAAAQRKR